MIDIVVFDINKTFHGLALALWTKSTILHLKYVKEVVIGGGHIYLLKARALESL